MSAKFDKKLAELDAYLQMLIAENEAIDRKLDSISSSTSNLNSGMERDGLVTIKNNLENLLGSIKYSIVLLQIARVSKTSADTESAPSKPLPNRPSPSSSRSASSTPSSKQAGFRRSSKNQVPTPKDTLARLASFDNSNLEQEQDKQSQFASSSQTSAAAAGPSSALPRVMESNVETAAGSGHVVGKMIGAHHAMATIDAASSVTTVTPCENFPTDRTSGRGDEACGTDLDHVAAGDDDDDDDFFDAADDQHNRSTCAIDKPSNEELLRARLDELNTKSNDCIGEVAPIIVSDRKPTRSRELLATLSEQIDTMPANSETNNNINTSSNDGSIDWDALYEDEDEQDLGSLESQGSVIKHLLSQIRIGMDLTKVVLPTFILERRSLLEMYADFFAHPDLFSSIPDHKTPEERMVQLVRWYLSAFHAGRKSSVAKKPYNPILGEIFKCQWRLVDGDNKQSKGTVNKSNDCDDDGEKLIFVAEQVSHHPPVSAFYAENKKKSISCCAHIYTKSKYLGLSVGVHNVGQGVIKLLDHNESYVCTFPSAFGRSILTVPWVELGGPVSIVCNETGYKANIEFVTKPFYGGKKHRVMGEILRPNNERFLTIDGEWNGIMYSKSAAPNCSEKQIFVDTTSLPVIAKHVKPVSVQDSFESRNVWKEVTRALKLQDITTATAAKSFIEQRQRDLLKERMEKGVKWKTRYFDACDDGWVFSNPLSSEATVAD